MPGPPLDSFTGYPVQRDIREWEEYDDDYGAQRPIRIRRERVRDSEDVPVPAPAPLPTRDDRDGRSSGRSSRETRDNEVDFEKACTKLKMLLNAAIKQFRGVEKEFQDETKLIEKYASKRILDDLWRRKTGVDQDLEDNDDIDDIDQDAQTHASKAYFLERKVLACLTRIVDANVDGRKDDIERQSDVLLQTKIGAAMQCIMGIWPKISSSRKQCSRLLTELNQLFEVLKAAYPDGGKEAEGQRDGYGNSAAQQGNDWAST